VDSQVSGMVRDKQRNPVAGVAVSDGLSVCLTGSDGTFDLPGWAPHVWICPPSDWSCSRWWQRRRPTLDFILAPAPLLDTVRLAHITDLHLTLHASKPASVALTGSVLHSLAGAIRNSRADLIVGTGDITDRGTVAELKGAVKALNGVGVPFRLIPGNHDHYGHQDEPDPADMPAFDSELGSGTFTRWERVVGPRWWSMNIGDLHLVALDWFSARCGRDRTEQLSWLAADLAHVPSGRPVILLSHDSPEEHLLQSLRRIAPGVRLVGTLSGHWHSAKAVVANRTLHLSTGPPLLPGRDLSPPHFRLVFWDGDEIESETIVPAGATPARHRSKPPKWVFENRVARANSLHLATHPEGVVATTANHDRASGVVALLDGSSGRTIWRWRSPQAIASAAVSGPDHEVYVQSIAGTAMRLDGGRLTWMVEAPDSVRTRVVSAPMLTDTGGLLTVSRGLVRCIESSNGRVRWTRHLGDADEHYSPLGGRMFGDLAVMALAGVDHGLTVIQAQKGTTLWADGPGAARSQTPPAALGDGTMIVVREGGSVERVEVATGRTRWRTSIGEQASTAEPVVIEEFVLIVSAGASIFVLDSKTGWVLRVHRLPEPATPAGTRPGCVRVGAAVQEAGGVLHVLTAAGEWWRLDPFHWEPDLVATLPVAVTSKPVEVDGNLVIPGREGYVLAASCHLSPEAGLGLAGRSSPVTGKRAPSDRWLRLIKPGKQ
jgi:outer membrane protein assembly factor BamB/predicted MPP superfamily phosphohydrolase